MNIVNIKKKKKKLTSHTHDKHYTPEAAGSRDLSLAIINQQLKQSCSNSAKNTLTLKVSNQHLCCVELIQVSLNEHQKC